MTAPVCVRADDRLPMLRTTIDPEPLLHRWQNADPTHTIRSITFSRRDDQVSVEVVAVEPDGLVEWGEAPVTLFTDISCSGAGRANVDPVIDGRPTPHHADISAIDSGPAFTATFERSPHRVHLQGRINVGLLVVEVFNEVVDGSDQNSHYHRECFGR